MKKDLLHTVFSILLLLGCCPLTQAAEAQERHTATVAAAEISRAEATDCEMVGDKEKCKFDTQRLQLQDGATIELIVKQHGRTITCRHRPTKGQGTWLGECDGDAENVNLVKRVDKDGIERMFGSISVGSNVCRIGFDADDTEQIECTPDVDFPDDDDENELLDDDDVVSFPHQRDLFGISPGLLRRRVTRQLDGGEDGNIDVMVVWTNESECLNAGLEKGCLLTDTTEESMRGLIDLIVIETNVAFELSNIETQLRLVHAYRDGTYEEPESTPYLTMAKNLKESGDNLLDDVHGRRALYRADIVGMLVASPERCGISYRGPAYEKMFFLANYACAAGSYSFAHELTHTLGTLHDRGSADNCVTNDYRYAYRDPDAEFRTIGAYNCRLDQCDNMPKAGCGRIQMFSNTKTLHNGKIVGDARHDNARKINEVRSVVANYLPAWDCTMDSECYDAVSIRQGKCITSVRGCDFSDDSEERPSLQPQLQVPSEAPTIFSPLTSNPLSKPEQLTLQPSSYPSLLPSKNPAPVQAPNIFQHPTALSSVMPSLRPLSHPSLEPSPVPFPIPSSMTSLKPSFEPSQKPSGPPVPHASVEPSALPTAQTLLTPQPTITTTPLIDPPPTATPSGTTTSSGSCSAILRFDLWDTVRDSIILSGMSETHRVCHSTNFSIEAVVTQESCVSQIAFSLAGPDHGGVEYSHKENAAPYFLFKNVGTNVFGPDADDMVIVNGWYTLTAIPDGNELMESALSFEVVNC